MQKATSYWFKYTWVSGSRGETEEEAYPRLAIYQTSIVAKASARADPQAIFLVTSSMPYRKDFYLQAASLYTMSRFQSSHSYTGSNLSSVLFRIRKVGMPAIQ